MITFLIHIVGHIIQNFFLGIGGISRWLLFQSYNVLYSEKFPKKLSYYTDNENTKMDKNSLTVANKNFFINIIILILTIVIIEKIENN